MRIERPLIAAPLPPQAPRVQASVPDGPTARPEPTQPSSSFGRLLHESVQEVNQLQLEADAAAERVSTGQVKTCIPP